MKQQKNVSIKLINVRLIPVYTWRITLLYSRTSDIVDPPNKGHCMLDLSIKDAAQSPNNYSPHSFNTLRTSKRGQPLYQGQNG